MISRISENLQSKWAYCCKSIIDNWHISHISICCFTKYPPAHSRNLNNSRSRDYMITTRFHHNHCGSLSGCHAAWASSVNNWCDDDGNFQKEAQQFSILRSRSEGRGIDPAIHESHWHWLGLGVYHCVGRCAKFLGFWKSLEILRDFQGFSWIFSNFCGDFLDAPLRLGKDPNGTILMMMWIQLFV